MHVRPAARWSADLPLPLSPARSSKRSAPPVHPHRGATGISCIAGPAPGRPVAPCSAGSAARPLSGVLAVSGPPGGIAQQRPAAVNAGGIVANPRAASRMVRLPGRPAVPA